MNFICVLDQNRKERLVNLDNITQIKDDEGHAVFETDHSYFHTETTVEEVQKIIEDIQAKNHRIRIDGLKGETLNVKVVNK